MQLQRQTKKMLIYKIISAILKLYKSTMVKEKRRTYDLFLECSVLGRASQR